MKPWQIRTPHAFFWFNRAAPTFARFREEVLLLIPGVREERNGSFRVPENAIPLVANALPAYKVSVTGTKWGIAPPKEATWEEVEAELRKEIKPEFLGDWPKPYQKAAVAKSWRRSGYHLWHATGAGKSFTGFATCLSGDGLVIIVTRSASKIQFAREVTRFTGLKTHILRTELQRVERVAVQGQTYWTFYRVKQAQGMPHKEIREAWRQFKETHGLDKVQGLHEYLEECRSLGVRPVVVVPWETLREHGATLVALRPSSVLFDEAHRGKNHKRYDVELLKDLPADPVAARAQQKEEALRAAQLDGFIKEDEEGARMLFTPTVSTASAAAALARASSKVVLTTATPLSNRVRDLWAQLDLAEPNAWGNASSWLKRYADAKPGQYGGMDTSGQSNKEELRTRLTPVIHVVTKAEAQKHVPPLRRVSYYISPEDLDKEAGGSIRELQAAEKRGATAVLEVKLARAASQKRKAVMAVVGEHLRDGLKVCILTARRRDVDDLVKALRREAPGIQYWGTSGDDSGDVRQGIVDEYMAHPGPCALIGTGQSLGESLNLDKTDTAFFVMLPYTPEAILQWEGRYFRNSTTKSVTIYYVIAEGTVDERIASILLEKLPAVGDLANDSSAAGAMNALAGKNENETEEEFAASILGDIDED